MVEVGRNLWRTSCLTFLLKEVLSEQAVQSHMKWENTAHKSRGIKNPKYFMQDLQHRENYTENNFLG